MSSYFYIFCKVLLHFFIIFYFSNYRKHLYMLYFFHEIHPHKHSKNHRGCRTCHSLCLGSQAGLCSFCRHRCNSFGSADKKRNPAHSPCPPSCLCSGACNFYHSILSYGLYGADLFSLSFDFYSCLSVAQMDFCHGYGFCFDFPFSFLWKNRPCRNQK